MTIYTIPQKMSNTGSIHDLASQFYARRIKFPKGTQYAVVQAAFYGEISAANLYTTHRTAATAAKASRALSAENISHQIIDAQGKRYVANRDQLVNME